MTRPEKVTREILHFSLRVVCQLLCAASTAESSQNWSPDGTQPTAAMLTHQQFYKVKCPSTAGPLPFLGSCVLTQQEGREELHL